MSILAETANTPEAWSARAAENVEPWTACGWTFDGQLDRMIEVLYALDPGQGEYLLDWGCGTGGFADMVPEGVAYIGYDYAEGMIERARGEHPYYRFQSWEPQGQFDHVACIGPFNLRDGWSKEMTWYTLRRLFERTKQRLVASLYAGEDPACFSYSIEEADRFAKGEGYRAYADRWRHNDVLVVLER